MPPPKRGVSAKGRRDPVDEDFSPSSSPRGRANEAFSPRGARGRIESPTKSSQAAATAAARKNRTTEDVRAEASPIVPRGRGRPPKTIPVANKVISDFDVSPTRRSRRITEQTGDEDEASSSRRSPFSSPMKSTKRSRQKSGMESADEPSEGAGYDGSEGRGKRKRRLTEAAEASHAQSRSRMSSRRISERTEQHLDEMEHIHEELTEPIEEEEIDGEEMIDEVAHEEMVHAVSPQDMYMQSHLRPLHSSMGGARTTRGMHIVSDQDDLLDQQLVEEEHAIDEMVMYDDEGNMVMGYEGDEMGHEEIIDGMEDEMMEHHDPRRQHIIQPHEIKQEEHHHSSQEGEEDDDEPPQLEPEEGPGPEEIMMHENMEKGQFMESYDDQDYMPVQSPGGTTYLPTDNAEDEDMYVDGLVDPNMVQMLEGDPAGAGMNEMKTVEFNFLDNKNVCCGLCGDIVPYESLMREHLPLHHPEVYGDNAVPDLEEIGYEDWMKEKFFHDKKMMESGFRAQGYIDHQDMAGVTARRTTRRVSQIRVNPGHMSLAELEVALRKKMVEKMGRKVKVSLVDKMHARCGICNAVVSLNKKFEVVHLVRHFNAWHPAAHRCAGTWPNAAALNGPGKPLSCQDFSIIDNLDSPESLQCIWCGMFMDRTMLAMHFHEVHPDDVEVPKCHLCLQEVVINARLMEKHKQDFNVILPDEHHIKCAKLGSGTFSTEAALFRCIERRWDRLQAAENGEIIDMEEEGEEEDEETPQPSRDAQYSNSRMAFGRRNKPKRNFIMPCLRQAIPQDSQYVQAISEGAWRCKMCNERILAAVISAGAIKHYRQAHPEQLEDMQYELCKARLERVSDGCMEFVHPQLIECLICNMSYALHKPYNMCRGIRHLKSKHPEMMPEFKADTASTVPISKKGRGRYGRPRVEMGEYVDDPEVISKLKQEYDVDFDKVQTMYTNDGERILVLVADGQEVDEQVAESIQASILEHPADGQRQRRGGEGEGEEEEGEVEEEGVIEEEEEEYPMEEEIVVRRGVRRFTAGQHHRMLQGHQMEMMEEEVVEEGTVEHQEEEEEVHDEMGEEREIMEEELEEQEIQEGQ